MPVQSCEVAADVHVFPESEEIIKFPPAIVVASRVPSIEEVILVYAPNGEPGLRSVQELLACEATASKTEAKTENATVTGTNTPKFLFIHRTDKSFA